MTTAPAVSAQELPDEIKCNLRSIETTTTLTLSLLRAILASGAGTAQDPLPNDEVSKNPATKSKGTVATKISGTARRPAGKKLAVKVHQNSTPSKPIPCLKDRRKYATEIVNTTLKTLSAAARLKQDNNPELIPRKQRTILSITATPLNERSLNRLPEPSQGKVTSVAETSAENVAYCTSAALDCLRLQGDNDAVAPFDLGTENAALVLVDKCIALDLPNLAEVELQKLHDQYWKRRKDTGRTAQSVARSNLTNCLYAFEEQDAKLYKFATSFQTQCLRLLLVKGCQPLDVRLVEALDPDTAGSPAWTILISHRHGHIDATTCSRQLLTVSRAISQLQASATDAKGPLIANPAHLLHLSFIASHARCLYWKIIQTLPDLPKELWSPLVKSLKRYYIESKKSKDGLPALYLSRLHQALNGLGFCTNIPTEVLQLVPCNGILGKSENVSDDEQCFSETKGSKPSALLQCIKTGTQALSKGHPSNKLSIQPLEAVLEKFAVQTSFKHADLPEVLLEGAHLRKQALAAIAHVEDTIKSTPKHDLHLVVQQACAARIIYALFDFLLRAIRPSSNSPSTIYLSLAKTVEAITALEQYSFVKGESLLQESRTTLLRCLELSSTINHSSDGRVDPSVQLFFRGLPSRVSQCFWARYRHLTEKRGSITDRFDALNDSLQILQKFEQKDRKSGKIIVKFEELSRLLLEKGAKTQARAALKAAIECQIEQGHLSDAAQAALTTPTGRIWESSGGSFVSLGQNLTEFCKLAPLYDIGWYFDLDQLQFIDRAVLVERQVMNVLSLGSSPLTVTQIRSAVQAVLAHSTDTRYRSFRLRFVSYVLRLLERSKRYPASEVFSHRQLEEILEEKPTTETLLPVLGAGLSVTVRTQWALACGEMHEELLATLLPDYESLLSSVGTQDQALACLHDPQICASQIQAIADFAGVLGSLQSQRRALEILSRLQVLCARDDRAKRALCLSQIGVLESQAGDTTKGGKLIAEAEKLLDDETGDIARTTLLLDHAEYLLNIGNLDQCSTILDAAIARISPLEPSTSPTSSKTRFQRETCSSRHAFISSRLTFSKGLLFEAFVTGRQATKQSTGLWVAIGKTCSVHPNDDSQLSDSSLQLIAEDISKISLCDQSAPKHQFQGAMYWSQVTLHRAILQHMGLMASHAGLFQDALFYLRQVAEVVKLTAGRGLKALVDSDLALTYAAADHFQVATSYLIDLTTLLPARLATIQDCSTALNLSEAFWLVGDIDQSKVFLDRTWTFQWDLESQSAAGKSSLPANVTPRKKKLGKSVGITPSKKYAKPIKATWSEQQPQISEVKPCPVHKALLGRIEAMQHRIVPVAERATQSTPMVLPRGDAIATVAKAISYLQQATALFSVDPANSSLAETALAFPVRYCAARKSGQLSLLLEDASQSPLKMDRLAKMSSKYPGLNPVAKGDSQAETLLLLAYEALRHLQGTRVWELPSPIVHLMHQALSQLNLLSTALVEPLTYSPSPVVLQCLVPKDVARSRERIAIAAEMKLESLPSAMSDEDLANLINTLPTTWQIVSIGLNHDHDEVLLSKISAGVSPFLLRVPLARAGIDDVEAQPFTLDFAQQELEDIIETANANTHDPRGHGDKQTRSAWYVEREALDERLECLLRNIENIWLGGFKGMMSSHRIDYDMLARFGQSLTQALNKHLPSRQKFGRAVKAKVELHVRVLELFVTMKFEETAEFEDAITDLLYFVVDMLHFNGEPNAVDEIDFDELLVDLLDALRGYHHALQAQSSLQSQSTILILDKELHGFPWESLPCLRGQAIYRMPSLGAIKERVDLLRTQSAEDQALKVSASAGMYILNPSGDLSSTQETFSTTFNNQLPHFTSITNRIPTEYEFQTSLTDYPLFLYFGHGSGAQYIHGRKIRALQMQGEQCAVSWLMGCSSLKMTECGIYEPYGMPWHYINGGCNAVVGTLWDVTDREIDRFAMKALVEWGLLKEDEETRKPFTRVTRKTKRAKGKGKAKENKEQLAIGEAVAVARDVCLLRYLNGAAPVVYGVPVSLHL